MFSVSLPLIMIEIAEIGHPDFCIGLEAAKSFDKGRLSLSSSPFLASCPTCSAWLSVFIKVIPKCHLYANHQLFFGYGLINWKNDCSVTFELQIIFKKRSEGAN